MYPPFFSVRISLFFHIPCMLHIRQTGSYLRPQVQVQFHVAHPSAKANFDIPYFSPTFPHPSCVPLFWISSFFSQPARSIPGLLLKGHTRGPVVSGFAGLIGSRQTGLKPHWGRCLSAGRKSKNQSRPAAQSRQSAAWRAAIDGCQASRASRSQQRYFPTLARVQ